MSMVVCTYANQHKKAFLIMAENHNKAIQKLLAQIDDVFISIEAINTYGNLSIIE